MGDEQGMILNILARIGAGVLLTTIVIFAGLMLQTLGRGPDAIGKPMDKGDTAWFYGTFAVGIIGGILVGVLAKVEAGL